VEPEHPSLWQVIDTWSADFKRQLLDEFAQELVSNLRVQESDAKDQSYVERLLTKIVDNIQITIRNIHVRYEDKLSAPELPFSCGATLKELRVSTCNENWEPHFFDRNEAENKDKPIFKKLQVDSFAVYLKAEDYFLLTSHQQSEEEEKEEDPAGYTEFVETRMGLMFPPGASKIEHMDYLI